jgi:hypothetical protein
LQGAFLILGRKVLMVLHPLAEVGLWSRLAGMRTSSGWWMPAVATRWGRGRRGEGRQREQHRQHDDD